MKRKHFYLAGAALLVAGGLWFARSASRTATSRLSIVEADLENPKEQPKSGEMRSATAHHAPPDPSRRFRDFTPEQRVEFARKGHGPGG